MTYRQLLHLEHRLLLLSARAIMRDDTAAFHIFHTEAEMLRCRQ